MKVFGKYSGRVVTLTKIQKRRFIWPGQSGMSLVFLNSIKTFRVLGYLTGVVVAGFHAIDDIGAEEFTYTSQDGLLTLKNKLPVTGVITTKGAGEGTTITEEPVPSDLPAIISAERFS